MIDPFSRTILNRRPRIQFIGPKSSDTVPEPSDEQLPITKADRVDQIIKALDNITVAAEQVEEAVADRAKDVVFTLDPDDPADFVVAQAAARIFPDNVTITEPLALVTEITFPMYRQCVQDLKAHGKRQGTQNQIPEPGPADKVDFGGFGMDRRPGLNGMSVIMPPVPIPAYILFTIPILFSMLFPLTSAYVKSSIIGHTHVTVSPGSPTSPGVPTAP